MTQRKAIQTDAAPAAIGPYSQPLGAKVFFLDTEEEL